MSVIGEQCRTAMRRRRLRGWAPMNTMTRAAQIAAASPRGRGGAGWATPRSSSATPSRCGGSASRCCPPARRPLRVLHLSDLHLTAAPAPQDRLGPRPGRPRARPGRQHRRQPGPPRRRARGAGRAGAAAGATRACSSWAPTTTSRPSRKNPALYLTRGPRAPYRRPLRLPTADLVTALTAAGLGRPDQRPRPARRWPGTTSSFVGVDDPHLDYDRYAAVAGPADPLGRRSRSGSRTRRTSRVLDAMTADGAGLVHRRPHPRRAAVPARSTAPW